MFEVLANVIAYQCGTLTETAQRNYLQMLFCRVQEICLVMEPSEGAEHIIGPGDEKVC